MESLIGSAILKLEQWDLFCSQNLLLLQMLWIAFCNFGILWEIYVDLKLYLKSAKKNLKMYSITFVAKDIVNTIKKYCSSFKIVILIIDSKITFSLNNFFYASNKKISKTTVSQNFVLHIYIYMYTKFQKVGFNNKKSSTLREPL